MNNLSQLAAVFAIAGGAGLLAYSRHIDPPLVSAANTEVMMNSVPRGDREVAATSGGLGDRVSDAWFVDAGGALDRPRVEAAANRTTPEQH